MPYISAGKGSVLLMVRSYNKVVKDKPESDTGEQRVNEILDKISREGLDSLTEKEREILRKASN